jgi:RHS repeat-associated protein
MGSTRITTDDNGDTVSEMRYSPWGSVRFSDGVSPTDYQYNGHLSISYLNIIKMGIRWYDPALGRFTQPDSIIPGTGNPMAFDRYMYVFSNPLKYVDPTGNIPESDTEELNEIYELIEELALYGIEVTGVYDIEELEAILEAAKLAGIKLSAYIEGESTYIDAFRMVHGEVIIDVGQGKGPGPGKGNCITVGGTISCHSAPNLTNTIHEFGHVFDNNYAANNNGVFASGSFSDPFNRDDFAEGYKCLTSPCLEHSPDKYPHDYTTPEGIFEAKAEEFADRYMNWVLEGTGINPDKNGFTDTSMGNALRTDMDYYMENVWIPGLY